jgi:hypothetical protein
MVVLHNYTHIIPQVGYKEQNKGSMTKTKAQVTSFSNGKKVNWI